jgi:hypothetical protein
MITTTDIQNALPDIIEGCGVDEVEELKAVLKEGIELIETEQRLAEAYS